MATMNPSASGVPYRIPPEPSRTPSIIMAVLVHAGLLLFLSIGISWQNTEPLSVEAEVWDLKTQDAAPKAQPQPVPVPPRPQPKAIEKPVEKPVEPPPQVKPPDINLERDRRIKQKQLQEKQEAEEKLKLEKARQELADEKKREQQELAEKKAQEKADKLAKAKEAAAEKAKLDKLREDQIRRITGSGGSGTAEKSTAPKSDPSYYAAIGNKIKSNLVYAGSLDVPGDPRAEFQIDQLPTGEIVRVKKTRSSGVPGYDEAVENAIAKSSPLPKKKDGTVERSVPATFRLKENVQ